MLFCLCKQKAAGVSYQIAAEWKSALFETFSYEGLLRNMNSHIGPFFSTAAASLQSLLMHSAQSRAPHSTTALLRLCLRQKASTMLFSWGKIKLWTRLQGEKLEGSLLDKHRQEGEEGDKEWGGAKCAFFFFFLRLAAWSYHGSTGQLLLLLLPQCLLNITQDIQSVQSTINPTLFLFNVIAVDICLTLCHTILKCSLFKSCQFFIPRDGTFKHLVLKCSQHHWLEFI